MGAGRLISVTLTLLFIPSSLAHIFFWFALLRWARQVIIEQVNHSEREREEGENRKEGGRYIGGGGSVERFFFLLELLLNNCTAVCISGGVGCQAAYEMSCVGEEPCMKHEQQQ